MEPKHQHVCLPNMCKFKGQFIGPMYTYHRRRKRIVDVYWCDSDKRIIARWGKGTLKYDSYITSTSPLTLEFRIFLHKLFPKEIE